MTPLEFLGYMFVYGTVFVVVFLAAWAIIFLGIPPWLVALAMLVIGAGITIYRKWKGE